MATILDKLKAKRDFLSKQDYSYPDRVRLPRKLFFSSYRKVVLQGKQLNALDFAIKWLENEEFTAFEIWTCYKNCVPEGRKDGRVDALMSCVCSPIVITRFAVDEIVKYVLPIYKSHFLKKSLRLKVTVGYYELMPSSTQLKLHLPI